MKALVFFNLPESLVSEQACMTLNLRHLKGMQPLILLMSPVLFLLGQFKISAMKKYLSHLILPLLPLFVKYQPVNLENKWFTLNQMP